VDEQLREVAQRFIQLAEAKGQATRDQCLLLGHLWGDNDALKEIAKMTEASEALLRKAAGAGKVGLEELWPVKQVKEWAYQISLWPFDDWGWISDIADGAELKAGDLKSLRICVEKIGKAGGRVDIEWENADVACDEEPVPLMVRSAIEEPEDFDENIEDAIPF
jgi:hypothetical protein